MASDDQKKELKEYIDAYVKHIIDFQLKGNRFNEHVKNLKKKHLKKIFDILYSYKSITTRKQRDKVREEVEQQLIAFTYDVNEYVKKSVETTVDRENEWLEDVLAKFLNISIVIEPEFVEKLLNTPIAYAGIVKDFGDNVVNKYRSLFYDAIAASYITGVAIEDLDSSYRGRLNAIDRGLEAEAKTMGSSMGGSYDRIVFTRNTKMIKGYIWSSILDSSTCLVCGNLNGTIYKTITKVPLYPIHYRCRCFLIPFTEEVEEVIPKTYEEWFEEQSESDKETILGKTRYQLYKNGMKIGDFVDNGQKTPLERLGVKNKKKEV